LRNYFKSRPSRPQHPGACSPLAGLALGVVALALGPGASGAACPMSSYVCQGAAPVTTSAATFNDGCENVIMEVSTGEFNVPGRTFRLFNDAFEGDELYLADDFTVSGPPAGSPVPLHLRVRFHGTLGGFGGPGESGHGFVAARPLVAAPGDPPPAQTNVAAPDPYSGMVTYADSLDLSLVRPAGAPTSLEIHALLQRGYSDVIDASFVFLDLPPGASVSSCKGYSQAQPVPAVVRSWGSVKAIYR